MRCVSVSHQEDFHCDRLPLWPWGLLGDAQSRFFGWWCVPDPLAVQAPHHCLDAMGNQRPNSDTLSVEPFGFGCLLHVRLYVSLGSYGTTTTVALLHIVGFCFLEAFINFT